MKNMKKYMLLVPFFAVIAVLLISVASAGELASSVETRFNDVILGSSVTMAGDVASVVPVRVTFRAIENMDDVKVKVRMEGHRDDVSASTSRFDLVDGSTYTKLLSLALPSDEDDLTGEYTLYVEIISSGDRTEEEYTIRMQRESYTLDVVTVDYSSSVSAGDVVPVSVVVENTGFNFAEDNYVVVSIPALGISSRGYVGDLGAIEDYDNDNHEEDAAEEVVYLKVPENAQSGVYEMEIEVYNDDASTTVRKLISVGNSASTMVLAAVKNQDMNAGETKTYDLVIVNSADSVKVFNIQAVSGDALSVSVPSVVTVGPDASETVSVAVTASDDASVGLYTFSVDVNGEQVVFGANVVGSSVSASVVAWTIVLVIIFVILLAVLVVLLTRKESKTIEEVETSYY